MSIDKMFIEYTDRRYQALTAHQAQELKAAFVAGMEAMLKAHTYIDLDEFEGQSLKSLAESLKSTKDLKADVENLKTGLGKVVDHLALGLIPEVMEEQGFDTVKIEGVGRVQLASDIRCSVPAEHREDLKDWLHKNGHDSMVAETVNSSALKAFVKERMKEDKPWPEEFLKVHPFTRASVVKT